MAPEAASAEAYEALLNVDSQLHVILSQLQTPAKKILLSHLQQQILDSLPEEIEDTTSLIKSLREKKYG